MPQQLTTNNPRGARPLLTGLWLVPSCGGIPKTMRKFQEALDARVVSFTDAPSLEREGSAFPGITHVPTHPHPLLKWYGYATPSARCEAESLAANANLLSCHVMLRYHANWVMRMARRHRIPYWFVAHGQLDPYVYSYRATVKKLWAHLFGKRLLRGASHVIFSTEQERRKAAWFYEGQNTRVIHWPVELIALDSKPEAGVQLRKRLGIPESDKILLYLGRLQRMKRPLACVQALAASERNDVHLVLVGPEEDVSLEDCRKEAAACGIQNQVHAVGPVYGDEKNIFLLGADAFLSLSHRENFGHTAAESLAAGTPVILSPGNDLAPELKPNDCGWFLESMELEEAASAIRSFADTPPATLLAMGLRGRDFIAKECSFVQFRDQLTELMREATGRSCSLLGVGC